MDFSVDIKGLDKLQQSSRAISQALADELNKAVYASAQQIRTEAIKSIQDGQKSGKWYKRRTVLHQSSAPGEAPASDTGRLVNSITAYAGADGEAFTVAGRGAALYAALLEFGTSRMGARPFMLPALEKSKEWISARLKEAISIGIGKK